MMAPPPLGGPGGAPPQRSQAGRRGNRRTGRNRFPAVPGLVIEPERSTVRAWTAPVLHLLLVGWGRGGWVGA